MYHSSIHPFLYILIVCMISQITSGQIKKTEGQKEIENAKSVQFDLPTFLKYVQPMKSDMTGRIPLQLWLQPDIMQNTPKDPKAKMEQMVKNAKAISKRGVLPVVWSTYHTRKTGEATAKMLLNAQAIHKANLPVHLLYPTIPGEQEGLWPADMWVQWKDKKFPVVDCFDTTLAIKRLKHTLKTYQDLGIPIAAYWSDHEGQPNPWNGTYFAFRDNAENKAKLIKPEMTKSKSIFGEYTSKLKTQIFKEVFVDTFSQISPKTMWGNYCYVDSTKNMPAVDINNHKSNPNQIPDDINVVRMHNVYAYGRILHRYIKPDEITTKKVDRIFYHMMLKTFSSSVRNTPKEKTIIPYIGPYVDQRENYDIPMSQPAYRELLRHIWLRGADSMFVFAVHRKTDPSKNNSALQSLKTVEDTRMIMDEVLAYREFLEHGQAIHFTWPSPTDTGVVWSALQLKDKVLVRYVTLGDPVKSFIITVFDNQSHTLTATPQGQYTIIKKK